MNVTWLTGTPTLNENGISEQLVVLTAKGFLSTGYYCKACEEWHLDGEISSYDSVQFWLSGLVSSNMQEMWAGAIKQLFPTLDNSVKVRNPYIIMEPVITDYVGV